MKWLSKWFWVLSVVMLICIPFKAEGQFSFDENPLIQKQAPNFTLKLSSGATMSLNQYRGSDSAIIFFWATWCPHCRGELKTLGKLEEVFKKNNIKIVLVNVEESPRLVQAFMDKIKLPYSVFLDEHSEISEQYSIIGLPTLFFIDRGGIVVAMEHGLPDNFMTMLGAATDVQK